MIDQHLDRVLERALAIGPATFGVVQAQAAGHKHPEETLRGAQGILRLAIDFTPAQLEAACERALALKATSYRAVRTLIKTPMPTPATAALDLAHGNVRGAEYFQ